MILGIGVDICAIDRIESVVNRFGARFIDRIYTPAEQQRAQKRIVRIYSRYAQMFAAKEAAVKALGTGFRYGISWRDIEIRSDTLGKPFLNFHGMAKKKLTGLAPKGFGAFSEISFSDERDLAQAMVVLYAMKTGKN